MSSASSISEDTHIDSVENPDDFTQDSFNEPAKKHVAKAVFYPAVGSLFLLVILALTLPNHFKQTVSWLSTAIATNMSWYYVLIATSFVVFSALVAFSEFGSIKLGKDDDEPEYSLGSWFAMLFAAGMGIGLVFYGAGEPLSHLADPRPGVSGDEAALARDAMSSTFLHWGLHPWSIYAVVGLAIAYAHFRKDRPISMRWTLEPLLGEKRVRGYLGDLIDIVAVVGTLLGIATSLGFGVSQLAAGIEYLSGYHVTKTVLVILVVVISSLAALSVATGLDGGIRFLSNSNLILATILALLVLILGPSVFIMNEFVQSIGVYLSNFVQMSFQTLPFRGMAGETWLTDWTTYYWGWWMSWSPFVGVFIARISRGRTIREFIAGVIAVPTLVTFFWFAIMGGNGFFQQAFGGVELIGPDGVDINTVLFHSFAPLPGGSILSAIAMILVTIFFITSSDSGSYVMAMLSSHGDPNPKLYVRLTLAAMTGIVTAAMLGSSSAETGMAALQSLAILAAFPFSFVMIGMCLATWRSARREHRYYERRDRELRRRLIVDAVSAQVVEGFETAVSEYASETKTRQHRGYKGMEYRSDHKPIPIPIAPELVQIIKRMKKNSKAKKNRK